MIRQGEGWIRWRVRAGYPVAVVCFLLAHPTPVSLGVGAGIALLGLAIRAAAAGRLHKHERLAVAGPYAHTRNPLYLGSVALGVGFAVATHSWIGAILLAAYFAAFYPAVMRREEKELAHAYGAAFDQYAAQVPLFWPRMRPTASHPSARTVFSWVQYRRNREYQAAVGFLSAIGLLWLRMLLRR